MALTYPIALADWFTGLEHASITFELSEAWVTSETGGGEILTSGYGTRLWGGTCTLVPAYSRDMERIAALGRALRAPGASFLVTPIHAPKPLGIPVMPGAPLLNSQQNGKEIKVGGLTSGDKLARGDFIGWTYGSSPLRYALHQLVEDATAAGSGITGWAEVVPPIKPGKSNATAVVLQSPVCLARMVPGSWSAPLHRLASADGVSFAWTQSLR
jgi:hypothetical protein